MKKKLILSVLFGFLTTLSFAADVYKYTDEKGNIYYSDKKPSNKINGDKLKKITISESDHLNPKSNWQSADQKIPKVMSDFENFFIASPQNNSSTTIEDNNMTVMVNLIKDLSSKYRVKFYLNGRL